MRIGIVTPYDNRNLGNRLQNYALQQVLLDYAEDVITIRNKPALPSIADRFRRGCPLADSVWFNRLLGEKRKARLLEFNRAYLHMSKKCYWYNRHWEKLHPEDSCDRYCAGSDQVWNPQLDRSGTFSYLGFAPGERTFSYAASFGIDRLPMEKRAAAARGLNHIASLSVREREGKKIAEELTGRTDVQILPDPTLLLTARQWARIARKPSISLPDGYLLTYFLGDVPEKRRELLRQTAAEKHWVLVDLMDPGSAFYAIGPDEFLYTIRHANLVCTDSFHGSVFSFLYQRPLWIFEREGDGAGMGCRLRELTETYCLQHCVAKENLLPGIPEKADYSAGYARLQEERLQARKYLEQVLRPEGGR